jgi:hypothetical protein
VAAAAGDAEKVAAKTEALGQVFERLTGVASQRRAGASYAGRSLVYEDSVRDVRVEVGRQVVPRPGQGPAAGVVAAVPARIRRVRVRCRCRRPAGRPGPRRARRPVASPRRWPARGGSAATAPPLPRAPAATHRWPSPSPRQSPQPARSDPNLTSDAPTRNHGRTRIPPPVKHRHRAGSASRSTAPARPTSSPKPAITPVID